MRIKNVTGEINHCENNCKACRDNLNIKNDLNEYVDEIQTQIDVFRKRGEFKYAGEIYILEDVKKHLTNALNKNNGGK